MRRVLAADWGMMFMASHLSFDVTIYIGGSRMTRLVTINLLDG